MKKQLILFATVFLMEAIPVFSQNCPTYTAFASALQGTTQVTSGSTINFPVTSKAGAAVLREKNKSAKLYFKLDLGNDYVKQDAPNWKFKVTVDLSYKFSLPGALPIVKTLTITENAPEMLKIEDVLSSFATSSPAFSSTLNIIAITDGTNTLSGPGLLQDFIFKNLRLSVELAREYEVDVRFASTAKMSNAPLVVPSSISNRLVTFSWQPNASNNYANYEVQVLKLFNNDPALQNDLNQISSNLDWARALDVETQSCKTSVNLVMGEGTGYYIWRVRPIGNFFPGGISNVENHGEWSVVGSSTATSIGLNKIALTPTNISTPYAFYFVDPDEDINWIYSRVFTEGDTYDKNNPTGIKSSEGMSYADGLLRIRQNQKFNSSENTNIVSQTINDYSGRPALSTIPVPTLGGLTGYKNALVQESGGGIYTAENFDGDLNINDPEQVKASGTAYSYYSGISSLSNNGIDNPNVPSAEGYPFKRTIYKADGTNRVEEESGVGKVHSIGSQVNGRGRTTRIFYSTPSEDELIRIFGEEAPLSQSVIKTTTVDQNDVISISYTSKEGKTIATALSSPSVSNLSAVGTITALTVNNNINQNVYSPGKIVASKRMAVSANASTLTLTHITSLLPGDNTGCIVASCNYKLRIYLKDVKTNVTYVSDANTTLSGINDFTTSSGTTLNFAATANWAFVDIAGINPNITPVGAGLNQIIMNAGEYIFIKELYSANAPGYGEALGNEDNEKTRPIFDAIANRMKGINNPLAKAAFDVWMGGLRTLVTAYNAAAVNLRASLTTGLLSHLCINPALLPPGFLFPLAPVFNLSASTTNTNDPTMDNLEITTSCCGSISAQVPKTSICIACEGNPDAAYQSTLTTLTTMTNAIAAATATDVTPYGFYDLRATSTWSTLNDNDKRAAVNVLVEREFIGALKEKLDEENILHADLWKMAPGFSFQSLNFMISNMLISQYYTGSAIENASTWYEATKNSQGTYSLGNTVSASSPTYAYNYDCKDLYNAWHAAIAPLNSFEAEAGPNNVLKGFDKSEGPGAALLEALNTDNWPPPLRDGLNLLKDGIKKVMNKFANSKSGGVSKERIESITNITSMFVQQAGQQFAAIIDGAPLATHISSVNAVYPDEYFTYTAAVTPTPSTIYTTISTGTLSNTYVPLLFTMNGSAVEISTTTCNSATIQELYYAYILKPEWMFKYYVYNVFENKQTSGSGIVNFIDDDDALLPNQVILDLQYCYNPPFSYLTSATAGTATAANLCIQPVTSSYTASMVNTNFTYAHENWSSKERYTFYDQIKGGGGCFETKGISTTDNFYIGNVLPVCPTKTELFAMANDILTKRIDACADKATEIKAALIDELESSCYTVVPCKSSTPLNGEVTLKEIDVMVAAVISRAVSELQAIKDNFTVTPVSNDPACATLASITQSYSPLASCNLPACVQTDCREIVLYENNTIGLTDSRTIEIKFFRDCDQKIMDMLESGSFLPYVTPIAGCTKTKVWKNCTGVDNCDSYGEKTGCAPSDFEKYSKEYTVTATGSGN